MAKKQPVLTAEAAAKKWLRGALASRRRSLTPAQARHLSAGVARAFISSRAYRDAEAVALFIGFGSEVQTGAIIRDAWRRGKDVVIPMTSHGFAKPFFSRYQEGDLLIRTPYGPLELAKTTEPYDLKCIDLMAVPGLGFDRDGFRLGYGGGVYDRLLKKTPRALHVGLFYGLQRVLHLPREAHDHPLMAIVTEDGFRAAAESPVLRPGRH